MSMLIVCEDPSRGGGDDDDEDEEEQPRDGDTSAETAVTRTDACVAGRRNMAQRRNVTLSIVRMTG
jgi:hypothetical protein